VIREWNDAWPGQGEAFPLPGYIAYMVYGIAATCLWDWVNPWNKPMNNGWKNPLEAMRRRVVPFLVGTVMVVFILGFLQYPSHMGNNGTMMGIVLWACTGLFMVFYFLVEKARFSLRLLTWLGKNPLICYLGIVIWNEAYWGFIGITAGDLLALDQSLLGGLYSTNAIPLSIGNLIALALILTPLIVLTLICYFLDKKDVKISG
jgi:hypothetical protein